MKTKGRVKLMILLVVVALTAVSCYGPKPCWGVSSDAVQPQTEIIEQA